MNDLSTYLQHLLGRSDKVEKERRHNNKIIWSGAAYPEEKSESVAQRSYKFSKPVSETDTGIILVFCSYTNSTPNNWGWHTFFVPKKLIEEKPGSMVRCPLIDTARIYAKYVGIYDTYFNGNSANTNTNTICGTAADSTKFVLRYVIAV